MLVSSRCEVSFKRLIVVLLVCWWLPSDARAPAPHYETRTHHDPSGIGKFYMGREIAAVMGAAGVAWLDRPQREDEEKPHILVAALEVTSGLSVADFGAGSGYYTFRIAPLVGDSGKVLAVDVQPAMLDIVDKRAREAGLRNVRTIRSTAEDPNLPARSLDLIFMVDVYHELEYPLELMIEMRKALKPGGRLAVIEYRAEDPAVNIRPLHKMSERQIVRELTAAGFRHVKTVRSLPLQHLIFFDTSS